MAFENNSDEYLMISGLQHFSFCRRQWALIHIEQQWSDNELTAEGQTLHQRVHDIHEVDIRNGIITMRDLPVKSDKLLITGRCDAVEFYPCETGIPLHNHSGYYGVLPIEYKHGHEKSSDCDRLQVTAQAICLEEMFSCIIAEGAIFYYETRRRENFLISEELRNLVKESFLEMHTLFSCGYTPKVKKHKGCSRCSLYDLCLPSLNKWKGNMTVSEYLQKELSSEENK